MVQRRIQQATKFIFTDTLLRVWWFSLLASAYSVPAVLWPDAIELGLGVEASLTFAIGLMLAIRVNQAYLRWWEGRTLWGKLVNVSRNLALKLRAYVDLDEADKKEAHRLFYGFPRALKNHLRGVGALQDIRGFEDETAQPVHVPAYLAGRIYDGLETLHKDARLSDAQMWMLDREARELMEVTGGCEKILYTPMARSFPAFVRFGIALLLLTVPWDLADQIGWWTVPAMAVTAFLVVGGEAIAEAIEQPFGTNSDNLDLEGICDAIQKSTAEILA